MLTDHMHALQILADDEHDSMTGGGEDHLPTGYTSWSWYRACAFLGPNLGTTDCWQIITGDNIICDELLTRPIKRLLKKAPPQAAWIKPLPPPAIEQKLRHWMQKTEYCVSGMDKKQAAHSILLRDNPKLSRCVISTVTTNECQRPEEAI